MVPLYVGDSREHEAFVIGEPKMLDFDSSENLLNILQSFRNCHCLYLAAPPLMKYERDILFNDVRK